ncbi:MAG: hypothetical protein HY791_01125 [Deltaproteobacteria bacterium]|nr:hypothetical protein [Deltaproteobacteria bacterium]
MPYGRVAIAPVDAQGELISSPSESQTAPRQPDWSLTVFAGALDAADGKLWFEETVPHQNIGNSLPPQPITPPPTPEAPPESLDPALRRRTQGRRLLLSAKVLGIGPDINEREPIARVLGVPCLVLNDAAKDFGEARLYADKGRVVVGVLRHLRANRGLCDHLLAAGVTAGLWGNPLRWDPGGAEHSSSFRRSANPP